MKYFPLSTNRFEHQFGIRALDDPAAIVEATDLYADEIKLKRELLKNNRDYYFCAAVGTITAQQDVLSLIADSASFLQDDVNTLVSEPIVCNEAPLLSIAGHVQEDLVIVSGEAGHEVVAGCVTFPSGWCIGDKLGRSMLEVHAPVPQFDQVLSQPTDRLLHRIKIGRPVWRMNWGVRASSQLDQSPIHQQALNRQRSHVTAVNAGQRCCFRVERQTLARLANSGDILFAIHTHQSSLERLSPNQRSNLLGVLRSCPAETLDYKGITPMLDPVVAYLDRSLLV